MVKFIKNYWILILISVVAVLFLLNKLLETSEPATIPSPSSTNVANFRSLLPGASTQDKVNELFGFPLKEEEKDNKKIAEYESSNIHRNHYFIFENGRISLVKEIVNTPDNKNSDSITSVYGEAPYTLFNKYPGSTFNLYVYPQNGIAYLGHEDKTLLEVWYFEPTSIEGFLSRWGQDYSKDKPKVQPEGY